MKEKISMVKLTEKQEKAVKGGVVYTHCIFNPPKTGCGCYILNGHCAEQLWPEIEKPCKEV